MRRRYSGVPKAIARVAFIRQFAMIPTAIALAAIAGAATLGRHCQGQCVDIGQTSTRQRTAGRCRRTPSPLHRPGTARLERVPPSGVRA